MTFYLIETNFWSFILVENHKTIVIMYIFNKFVQFFLKNQFVLRNNKKPKTLFLQDKYNVIISYK